MTGGNRVNPVTGTESGMGGLERPRRFGRSLSVRVLGVTIILVVAALCIVAFYLLMEVIAVNDRVVSDNERYVKCEAAIDDLRTASDYLTNQSRMFVVTGGRNYLDNYLQELLVVDRRGKAVAVLESYTDANSAVPLVTRALNRSNGLATIELKAMRLAAEARGMEDMPEALLETQLDEGDADLTPEEKLEKANELVLGRDYEKLKTNIVLNADAGTQDLIGRLHDDRVASNERLEDRLGKLETVIVALLVVVLAGVVLAYLFALRPLVSYRQRIQEGKPLVPSGGQEVQYLADAYNVIYAETTRKTEDLHYAANHDPLTGLRNRGAYDALLEKCTGDFALVLVDVDFFKSVNDEAGHETGDAVLKKMADAIVQTSGPHEYPCRIGGDEFAVVVTEVDEGFRQKALDRIARLREMMADTSDGLPAITLSIGMAVGTSDDGGRDLFRAADKALYVVKERGRNGHAFADEV